MNQERMSSVASDRDRSGRDKEDAVDADSANTCHIDCATLDCALTEHDGCMRSFAIILRQSSTCCASACMESSSVVSASTSISVKINLVIALTVLP